MRPPPVVRITDTHEKPAFDEREQPPVRRRSGRGNRIADVRDGVSEALLARGEKKQQDVPGRLAEEVRPECALPAAPLREQVAREACWRR